MPRLRREGQPAPCGRPRSSGGPEWSRRRRLAVGSWMHLGHHPFSRNQAPPLSRPRRADVGVRIPGVATERALACESTKLWEQRQWNLAAAMVPHVRRKPITAGGTCRWLAPGTPVQYTGGHCKKLAEIEVDGKLLCISLLQVGGIRCDEAGKQLCQPQPQASRLPDLLPSTGIASLGRLLSHRYQRPGGSRC